MQLVFSMKKDICFFTGARAEYGLLAPLMAAVRDAADLRLRLLVSGMHLAPDFGLTWRQIEADGFAIDERVEMLLASDTPLGMAKSAGLGLMGLAEALDRLRPACLVVLGDRFETFAAAAAAYMLGIPLAHLHGGEVTAGALDEGFRHAISKMSSVHLVATQEYRRRVIQLGEQPDTVHVVGALGIVNIRGLPLLSRQEIEAELGMALGPGSVLVTFHPATLGEGSARDEARELLAALEHFSGLRVVFTRANADSAGRGINSLVDAWAAARPERVRVYDALGRLRYLSTLRQVDAVIGNSSSGLIEAPSLGVPTVNIGDRQQGRTRAAGVIDCPARGAAIIAACAQAFSPAFRRLAAAASNPYEQPDTLTRIMQILRRADTFSRKKLFFDLPVPIQEVVSCDEPPD